ncbi:MAG: sulfotransferase [Rhodobacteraceae bacterium]|nr:sulfotransferase [Paracoccaceae bacterium]
MSNAAPDTTDFATLAQARAAWDAGDHDAALRVFAAAVTERPGNLRALLETARALGARFHTGPAAHLLDKALEVAGDDPRLRTVVAASWTHLFREDRAIGLLESISPRPAAARAELAALYERTHRLDAALAQIDACLTDAPDAPELLLARGRLLRRMGEGAMAKRDLGRVLDMARAPLVLAEAWTELCFVHDRDGESAAAVAAIEKAHALMRAQPGVGRLLARAAANNRAITTLSQSFRRKNLDGWRATEPAPVPGAARIGHLIGFPRSGTTLLEQRLDAHPEIVASPERVAFLRDALPAMCRAGGGPLTLAALDAVPPAVLARERHLYLMRLQSALGAPIAGRLHLDKNPNHTGVVPGLMRLFPRGRIVVALRDPRDVVTSCVLRSFRLSEFSAMLLDWQTAAELYAVEMGAWLRYRAELDPACWVETRYEDGIDDPEAQMRRVLAAFDLPWDDAVLDYRARIQHKVVNSPTQTEVRLPAYRTAMGRWRAYEPWLRPYLPILDPFIDAFGYR